MSHPPRIPSLAAIGASRVTRRRALAMLAAVAWAPPARAGGREVLAAYVDTLLPEDALSPAASSLGIDRGVAAVLDDDPRWKSFLARGAGWLDGLARQRGGTGFAALDEAARVQIVEEMETAPAGSAPRVFFEVLRHWSVELYYADPRSWPGLGFDGPPQPFGFVDYARPPGRR